MLSIQRMFNCLKNIFYFFYVVEVCSLFILLNSIFNFFYTVVCFKYVEKFYSYFDLEDLTIFNTAWTQRNGMYFDIPKSFSLLTNFNRFSSFWVGQVEVITFVILFFFVAIWCFNLLIKENQMIIFSRLLNAATISICILMFFSLNVFWNTWWRCLRFFVFDNNLLLDVWTTFSKVWVLFFGLLFINLFKKSLRGDEVNVSTDLVVLPVLGIFILLFLVSIINIFLIFVVLEIVSFIIMGLCVFNLSEVSLESTIKYFVFNTVVSGVTIFGMFCIYYIAKDFNLIFLVGVSDAFLDTFKMGPLELNYYFFVFSILMFIFIFLFKLNMFPVCFYILDVYESLPFSLIFFLSAVVKPCIFFLFLKIYLMWLAPIKALLPILLIFNILGMAIGNLMAIYTPKIKRFLALTSISLFSLLGCCLVTASFRLLLFAVIYLFIYTLVSYAILILFLDFFTNNESHNLLLSNLNVICHKDSLLKLVLSFYFLVLSGLPPLFLFIYKYAIFFLFFSMDYTAVVISIVFISLFSFYYYLNIIRLIWVDEDTIESSINGSISINNPYLVEQETYKETIDIFLFLIFIFILTIGWFDEICIVFFRSLPDFNFNNKLSLPSDVMFLFDIPIMMSI